jgi:hypothetical protein
MPYNNEINVIFIGKRYDIIRRGHPLLGKNLNRNSCLFGGCSRFFLKPFSLFLLFIGR